MRVHPPFAAFPGPVAPPLPNIPTPFAALPSSGVGGMIDMNALQASMVAAASVSLRERAKPAFASIAAQVTGLFQIKVFTSLAKGVLGSGPVPTFAPPYIPVGPVVNGTAFSPPGALL